MKGKMDESRERNGCCFENVFDLKEMSVPTVDHEIRKLERPREI